MGVIADKIMKICYATDYLPNHHRIWGGAEQACYRLAALLIKGGHKLSLLSTRPLTPPAGDFDYFSIPVIEDFFPERWRYRARQLKLILSPYDFISHLPAHKILRHIRPDVLHLHNVSSLSFSLAWSARKLGIPTVYSFYDYAALCPMGHLWLMDTYASYRGTPCKKFHGSYCVDCISAYRKLGHLPRYTLATLLSLRKRAFDFFLRQIDYFVVLSPANAQPLREYGIGPERIFAIPIPLAEEPDAQAEEGSILFVGVIQPRKGLHVLLAAMPGVLKRVPDARLYVLGELRANRQYEEIIASLQDRCELDGHIFMLGKRPYTEVRDYMRKASVLVIPEQWETIAPNTLTEGMVLGKAIVASRIGGILDFIRHGENGLLAATQEPQDFADKIASLLEVKDLRQGLSQEARKTGREQFSEPKVYEQLMAMYRSLDGR
jgi:glycosyltransferase involved in cell wall biosynthesis